MTNYETADFFADKGLVANPFPFYEHLRAKGPVTRMPTHNVIAVTGHEEGIAVFRDDENFSSVISPVGPLPPLPFTPEGEDITDQIEKHRHLIPFANMIPTLDAPEHTRLKGLLMGMITPRRLKENETAMERLADQQIDTFLARGKLEVVVDYAYPFAGLVLGDLLGVPVEDFPKLEVSRPTLPGQIGVGSAGNANDLFGATAGYFVERIEQRRCEPKNDVLGELAKITFADGSLPPVADVVKVATFLFGAGQGTTARLVTAALRFLAEDPALQQKLRSEPQIIPEFVEESLRLQGTVKSDFRLAKRRARVGDIEVPPGTIVMLLLGAMNRDPRRFQNPSDLRLDRRNVREHIAFGRGIHSCVGAPLARAEAKVALERILARTSNICVDEEKHGPPGARHYDYMATYLLQGLDALHLRFTPV
jgi:cytochrome P450